MLGYLARDDPFFAKEDYFIVLPAHSLQELLKKGLRCVSVKNDPKY